MIELREEEYLLFRAFLVKACGIDVPPEKRYLFTTRLDDILKVEKCSSFSEFYRKLPNSPQMVRKLVESMTTHETSFFRDGHPYVALREMILPAITAKKKYICSVGCSTGQEPYSLAMSLLEWIRTYAGPKPIPDAYDCTIMAYDVSSKILEKARRGIYTEEELARGVSDIMRMRYFNKVSDGWEVSPELRKLVRFNELNLTEEFSFPGCFDLIFCRNVVIYFSMELKKKLISRFCEILNSGGILMLGASETLFQVSDNFQSLHHQETVYYRKK